MRRALIAALAALLLAVSVTGVLILLDDPVEVRGGTAEQREVFRYALGLYEEAELRLPRLTAILITDYRLCGVTERGLTRVGRFEPSWPYPTIIVCTERLSTMVHELAHAWVDHNLTTGERLGFIRLRGLTTWRSRGVPWNERGSEHAAEVLVWYLLDLDTDQVRVEPRTEASLQAALEYLLEAGGAPLPSTTTTRGPAPLPAAREGARAGSSTG